MKAKNLKSLLSSKLLPNNAVICNNYPITDYVYDSIKKVFYIFSSCEQNTYVSKNELWSYMMKHVWDKADVLQVIVKEGDYSRMGNPENIYIMRY